MAIADFQVWDYVLFSMLLVFSIGIGLFYAFRGRKQNTTSEFLMGNRDLKVVPVSISLLVSYLSAILLLGFPAEAYNNGFEYVLNAVGMGFGCLLAVVVFVPLLYPLHLTSVFEYLHQRYNSKCVMFVGALIYILQQMVLLAIASFAPSTALEAVTGFPEWATVIIVGLVASCYTCMGGLKAVIWTDVFQALIMVTGLLAVVIQGSISVGGISNMWKISEEWGRTNVFNDQSFNPDPRQRQSFWSLIFGNAFIWIVIFGTNQMSYQRYGSLPTMFKARCCVLLNIIGLVFMVFLTCLAGISVFAYYADQGCDPLSANQIRSPNHIIPYFVMDKLAYPGIPGLFIASLFSGALSTVSSCLTALAAVAWDVFLEPAVGEYLSDSKKAWVTRISVLVFGAAGIGLSFLCSGIGGTVTQLIFSFYGAVNGPLMTLFLLGGICPWINWIGASVGSVLGLGVMLWVVAGSYLLQTNLGTLEMPIANCSDIYGNDTGAIRNVSSIATSYYITNVTTSSPMSAASPLSGIEGFYSITYLWYSAMGFTISSIIAFVISILTGGLKQNKINQRYMIPVADYVCCCLPDYMRKKMICGVEDEASFDLLKLDDMKESKLDGKTDVVVTYRSVKK